MRDIFDFNFGSFSEVPEKPDLGIAHLLPPQNGKEQRVLLISDIHANWVALKAVLHHAQGQYDVIWFLGDIVDWGPDPISCVRFVLEHLPNNQWRAGNHDLGVVGRLTNGWGEMAKESLPIHQAELERYPDLWQQLEDIVTLEKCGPLVMASEDSQQVLTHANLQNDLETMNGYLFPGAVRETRKNLHALRNEFEESARHRPSWLLAGHTHIPCLFYVSPDEPDYMKASPQSIFWDRPTQVAAGHYYINPGSVGQPRDGNPDASYAILDRQALTVTWHRVTYDIPEVVEQLYERYQGRTLAKTRQTLISMLEYGGSAKTELKYLDVYRKDPTGLIVR